MTGETRSLLERERIGHNAECANQSPLPWHAQTPALLVDVSASFGNAFFLRIFIEHSGLHTFFY